MTDSSDRSQLVLEETWSETLARAPEHLELVICMSSFGILYVDKHEGQNYALKKKTELTRPRDSHLGATLSTSKAK